MDIALVNPPFLYPCKEEIVLSQCIGLRTLSSLLKEAGHNVQFVDALRDGLSNVQKYANGYLVGDVYESIAGKVKPGTDLIGLSAPFSQLAPVAHDILGELKNRHPDAMLILGGVYPSSQPELAITSPADYIVVGEGERAIFAIANGQVPENIQGVCSPAGSQNSFVSAERVSDLDELPFPDYSIPGIDGYFDLSPRMKRGRTAALVTSRGCPFNCEFCSIHPVCGRNWRYRSAENVLEEIEFLNRRFQIRSLEIEDDNFSLSKERMIAILEGIIRLNEAGANLSWRTPNGIRIDTLDQDVISLMKLSRCNDLVLALEHGDAEMLDIMEKKLSLDKAYEVVSTCVASGIDHINIFVIVGYPGETQGRFESGITFLRRLRDLGSNIDICANIAQPYPATRLLARCRAEGYVEGRDFDNFLVRRDLMSTAYGVPITTPDFNVREVMRRRELIWEVFHPERRWRRYLQPLVFWR